MAPCHIREGSYSAKFSSVKHCVPCQQVNWCTSSSSVKEVSSIEPFFTRTAQETETTHRKVSSSSLCSSLSPLFWQENEFRKIISVVTRHKSALRNSFVVSFQTSTAKYPLLNRKKASVTHSNSVKHLTPILPLCGQCLEKRSCFFPLPVITYKYAIVMSFLLSPC